MKIGCCGAVETGAAVKSAGYDYLECAVTSLLGDQDDAAFAPILAAYQALPLPVPVFNMFLPGDLKIVGPSVDHAREDLPQARDRACTQAGRQHHHLRQRRGAEYPRWLLT